ncbi:MAG: pyridoxamine 5'-phosphate oxidase [Salibacteraceae bacterium]
MFVSLNKVMKEFKQRKDYNLGELTLEECPEHPVELLRNWLAKATEVMDDANAMVLSTVDGKSRPSSRVVLLRHLDTDGIKFYTNYRSHKARDVDANPNVALNFFWRELERQVRVSGEIERLSDEESDAYFKSRPVASQIGAIASAQSQELKTRNILEERVAQLTEEYKNKPIERPKDWGGYLVQLRVIEFWQGRPSRLHDRIQYSLNEQGVWKRIRLYP